MDFKVKLKIKGSNENLEQFNKELDIHRYMSRAITFVLFNRMKVIDTFDDSVQFYESFKNKFFCILTSLFEDGYKYTPSITKVDYIYKTDNYNVYVLSLNFLEDRLGWSLNLSSVLREELRLFYKRALNYVKDGKDIHNMEKFVKECLYDTEILKQFYKPLAICDRCSKKTTPMEWRAIYSTTGKITSSLNLKNKLNVINTPFGQYLNDCKYNKYWMSNALIYAYINKDTEVLIVGEGKERYLNDKILNNYIKESGSLLLGGDLDVEYL